jgi:hypothetical protein
MMPYEGQAKQQRIYEPQPNSITWLTRGSAQWAARGVLQLFLDA